MSHRVRLWTYQSIDLVERVRRPERVEASWDRVEPEWGPAYRWMLDRMAERSLAGATAPATSATPPIWAWHSCGGWQRGPTRDTAEALLSSHEIEQGVCSIELEVPTSHALLSWYGEWNSLLDDVVDGKRVGARDYATMFDVTESAYADFDDPADELVQACLPWIDTSWVVRVDALR